MKCNKCGEELFEDATFCSNCGNAVNKDDGVVYENNQTFNDKHYVVIEDKQSIILNIVSFISPIIGWIMGFCMMKKTPIKAKACITWATFSFVLSNVVNLIFTLLQL